MQIKSIDEIIRSFLISKTPGVLAIKGKWGVGKTYTWTQILEREKHNLALKKYCYVSLFGISSMEELSLAIFSKTQDVNLIGTDLSLKSFWKNPWLRSKEVSMKLGNFMRNLEFPYSKNIGVSLEHIAPFFLTETNICIDDFERNTEIKAEQLLGFVSFLKEEKKCKVVLIFNDEELPEKNVYESYREKVIDTELLFSTTPADAFSIAVPMDFANRELIKEYVLKLKINNIRLLLKILKTIDLVTPYTKHSSKELMKQIIPSMVLFMWAYYDKSSGKPPLDFILKWNRLSWSASKAQNPEDQAIKDGWAAQIRAYGFTHIDELDLAISKVVEHGHCEETGLEEALKSANKSIQNANQQQEFENAWRLFHDSLGEDEELLIASLAKGFKDAYQFITPLNLNASVRLLRNLGKDEIADELIDIYVNGRRDETALFNLDEYPFAADLDDENLRGAFKIAYENSRTYQSLRDVALSISKSNGWSEDALHVFESASVDDFYQLFTENQGENLARLIKGCLYFQSVAGLQHLAEKPRLALKLIGESSRLNALRVSRYGVEI